jgi:hypothetical protein
VYFALWQVFDVNYPNALCSSHTFGNIVRCARVRAGVSQSTGQVLSLLTFLVNRRGPSGEVEDFFDMDWDHESETCSRLFFASRGMVNSFKKHGQFITLDATCKTNRFNMPLVLLVGIDDTLMTAIFGVGLVLQEDIDSYTWLLNSFKRAVGNQNIVHIPSTHSNITVHSSSTRSGKAV